MTTLPADNKHSFIEYRPEGIYCRPGEFYIDPWKPVKKALITHAHADHARPGMEAYLCSDSCKPLLKIRVGKEASIESLPFAKELDVNGVTVSFHPAGHILGSSQIKLSYGGYRWVFSGDYNATHQSPSCEAFEPVETDTFVTESTFALPIYRWPKPEAVFEEINNWWRSSQALGRTCLLPAYPLGKSQRLLVGLDESIGPIGIHGNATALTKAYEKAGVRFPDYKKVTESNVSDFKGRGLILTSSAGNEPNFFRKLAPISRAFASGWMQVRGARRNRDFDRGFVLSDHSDWEGLLYAIAESKATRVGVTHGQTDVFARYLIEERGLDAFTVPSGYGH